MSHISLRRPTECRLDIPYAEHPTVDPTPNSSTSATHYHFPTLAPIPPQISHSHNPHSTGMGHPQNVMQAQGNFPLLQGSWAEGRGHVAHPGPSARGPSIQPPTHPPQCWCMNMPVTAALDRLLTLAACCLQAAEYGLIFLPSVLLQHTIRPRQERPHPPHCAP